MSFWDGGTPISADNLARLGPAWDGVVGTDGKYSTLNGAISAGWRKIILAQGASLNANLTISTQYTSIVALQSIVIVAGNFALNVTGYDCYFEGFRISNNTGVGFYVTGSRNRFFRCVAESCSSHGFHFNAGGGDHEMISCIAKSNGGDGVRLEASNGARISMLRAQSNTGYGVRDVSGIVQMSCSLINTNVAGQLSAGTPGAGTIDHSVKVT